MTEATTPEILVVDDEPDLRAMLAEYFGRHGFRVRTAADAAAARLALAARVPVLAILDIHMPGENGLSLARWLRDVHPGIGILMLTTVGESGDRVAGLELGADDYVPKPFLMRELLAPGTRRGPARRTDRATPAGRGARTRGRGPASRMNTPGDPAPASDARSRSPGSEGALNLRLGRLLLDNITARVALVDRALSLRVRQSRAARVLRQAGRRGRGQAAARTHRRSAAVDYIALAERAFAGEAVTFEGWVEYPDRSPRYLSETFLPAPGTVPRPMTTPTRST